jgi:hypothetical protein
MRYAGASLQGMGIYEYGDGGKACLHSCLHPVGAERTLITDHPETLLVKAKRQVHRICDAELTLACLPEPGDRYERSPPPRVRQAIRCYECGEEGHVARYCPERDDNYGDETKLMDHTL